VGLSGVHTATGSGLVEAGGAIGTKGIVTEFETPVLSIIVPNDGIDQRCGRW
jgi:hypothetical protein